MKKHIFFFLLCCMTLSHLFSDEEMARKKRHLKKTTKENPHIQNIASLPYERFVGMGSCCLTRFQIDRYLSKKFNLPSHSFGGGQLLDWVAIADYQLLSQAIENHLNDFFEYPDLAYGLKVDGYPRDVVYNSKYRIYWEHLFTRISDEHLVCNVLQMEYPIRKEKIDYLSQKFRDLKNYRTLYIISDPYEKTLENALDLSTLIRLRDALAIMRGNQNFSLLFCPLNQFFGDFENIFVRQIQIVENQPVHQGDDKCWDRILKEFQFKIKQPEVDPTNMDKSFLTF